MQRCAKCVLTPCVCDTDTNFHDYSTPRAAEGLCPTCGTDLNAEGLCLNQFCTGELSPKRATAHRHYYKDVSKLKTVDVYRVLKLFNVHDPCLQHAIKKLLVAGGRGAGKDITQDVQEAIDSLKRLLEMDGEDK